MMFSKQLVPAYEERLQNRRICLLIAPCQNMIFLSPKTNRTWSASKN